LYLSNPYIVVVHFCGAWLTGRKDFNTGKAVNLLAVSSPILISAVSQQFAADIRHNNFFINGLYVDNQIP